MTEQVRVEKYCTRCAVFIPWRNDRSGHQGAAGLCTRCYQRGDAVELGGRRRGVDVLEDWTELKAQGYTLRLAAARMGMTYEALRKAVARSNSVATAAVSSHRSGRIVGSKVPGQSVNSDRATAPLDSSERHG